MRERLILDCAYDEPVAHRSRSDEQRRSLFIAGLVRRAREWGVTLTIVDPGAECLLCGAPILTLEDAVPGRPSLRVDAQPSSLGEVKIMPSGVDAGKGLKLGGPILDRAHAAGITMYREHTCKEDGCDSDAA